MSKHTPGPWEIRDERADWHESGATFEIDTHCNEHIGFVTRSTCGISDKEALANARLIAAAPEMKERGSILATLAMQSDRYVTDPEFMQAVNDMIAIVKEAEGTNKIMEVDDE